MMTAVWSHFGRKARAWLRRSIRARLQAKTSSERRSLTVHFVGYEDDEIDKMVEYLLDLDEDDTMRYVAWQDAEAYHGRGSANGSWVIRWPIVEAEIADAAWWARRKLQRENDAARFPTLDEWLEAETKGLLEHPGIAGDADALSPELRASLARARPTEKSVGRSVRRLWANVSPRARECTPLQDVLRSAAE